MADETTAVAPANSTAVAQMPDIASLQASSDYGDPAGLAKIGAVGLNFMPRLQLFTSNSEEVKEGKINVATYGTIKGKDPVKPLAKEVLIVPIGWRAKAVDTRSYEKPVAFHKPDSEMFKAIRLKADTVEDSGCMYGPEYLVWLPDEKTFATYLMGTKTARNTAPAVKALLPRPGGSLRVGLLGAQYIKNDKYSWHGPTIKLSDQVVEFPAPEDILNELTAFLNPTDSVIPKSEPAPEGVVNTDR